MSVDAVAVKLPTFWAAQPKVWFAQAEAQFHLRSITTDETKYFHVVAALDQETATRLIDLINSPPASDKYDAIKKRLTETFDLSERERASRLLHFRPLGDSRPSMLMDEMLALLGEHRPCFLFEQLFLERLPEELRAHLVNIKWDNPRELAKQADALWSSREAISVSAVRRMSRPQGQRLQERKKAPAPSISTPSDSDQPCYFHRRFGEAARQCREPCNWAGNGKASR